VAKLGLFRMRIKHLWDSVHCPSKLKLLYARLTFSRLTTFYFIFSFCHFIIQLSFQIEAFTVNSHAVKFLEGIVLEGHATNNSLPYLQGNIVRMCSWVPANLNVDIDSCPVVYNGTAGRENAELSPTSQPVVPSISTAILSSSTSTLSTIMIPTEISSVLTAQSSQSSSIPAILHPASITTRLSETTTIFVPQSQPTLLGNAVDQLFGSENEFGDKGFRRRRVQSENEVDITSRGSNMTFFWSESCLWTLNYPVYVLHNTQREDIVFIAFQFWVLGMSVVALLNESIPHMFASLLTHMMATAWAGFQVYNTANFRKEFNTIIVNGACVGTNLLPTYWEERSRAELPSLVLNIVAMFLSCFLTWNLIKLFGWQTFKRVGASITINRVYKIVLILSIVIQLSLFFMAVTVCLWIDQLLNSVIGDLVDFLTLYKITSAITLALLLPWLMTGWFAVRRELRAPMFAFLILSFLYLGGWFVMLFSTTFRWTFVTWQFFSVMASASVFLTLVSIILGVVCRYNFGKGLLRYLNAHQYLSADDNPCQHHYSDMEKLDFFLHDQPLPSYDAAFQTSGQDGKYMEKTNSSWEFSVLPIPQPAVTRNLSDILTGPFNFRRKNSNGSTRSFESSYSYGQSHHSHSRNSSQRTSPTERWVIE